mmetsp:Transcript_32482/g.85800  ORF Transcript_32482/g.85800 Transcript_32482/m.85800 type:complete len:95 (+) Transcript_32482:30-314(+)
MTLANVSGTREEEQAFAIVSVVLASIFGVWYLLFTASDSAMLATVCVVCALVPLFKVWVRRENRKIAEAERKRAQTNASAAADVPASSGSKKSD